MNSHTPYPHPQPAPPLQLYLLAVLAVCGLLALWFAAFDAFQRVTTNVVQAFFAASLIEAGLVIEALALVRNRNSWYPVFGLIISMLVSSVYNYVQVSAIERGLAWWATLAFALGPLFALCFLSLVLGDTLTRYQNALAGWHSGRAEWFETQAAKAEIEKVEARDYQREQDTLARDYQREQDALTRRRQERREARQRKVTGTLPETKTLPETGRKPTAELPAGLRQVAGELPGDLATFRQQVARGEIALDGLTGTDLKNALPAVGSDRTGRNWLTAVRNGDNEI